MDRKLLLVENHATLNIKDFFQNDNGEWMVAKIFFITRTLWWQKKMIIDPAKNSREISQFFKW